jgi:integrase/recombinase XerD
VALQIGAVFLSAHSFFVTAFSTMIGDNFCFHTFRVEYQKNSEVNMMKELRITTKDIAGFREHLILEERSAATIQKYIRDIKAFAKYAEGAVTKETVIAYKKHLQEHYAVRSVNSILASINSLFVFLGWHDLKVKALKLQQQVYCPEEKELSKAEYARLCQAAQRRHNERLNLILQTICGTGIRVSELQFITVEAAKCGEAVVRCKGKTRAVFIVRELRQKLLRYAAEQGIKSGMIFVTRTGKPISRTNIWREMKALCIEADVNPQKVFPHNLRHLFARVFYGIEKDIAKLADILGHSSINTTRIYIISTGTEHRRRMENMHLIL